MHLSRPNIYPQDLSKSILALFFSSVVFLLATQLSSPAQGTLFAGSATLPGQQIWKQGVSSFLFGTNDTNEWSQQNIQTQYAIQQALRRAGFTLIRSFFPDDANDAIIERRIQTIENSDAFCLAVITNIFSVSFDEHLVQYLGNRCQMYEFGNEPDYNGISIEAYLKQWNKLIPLLKHVNPSAKFIGPVTYTDRGEKNFMRNFLLGVRASGVLPDVVSFHWYPCWQDTREACLAKASSCEQATERVRTLIHQILGKDLPVGISEWNYDPGNPPPAYGDDPSFIARFTTDALRSMVRARLIFACQFDAASYSGYGRLDMFNIENDRPKPQYYAIEELIKIYRTSNFMI